MSVVWPSGSDPEDLPDTPFLGYIETLESNVIVTNMQGGPAKTRRRYTKQRRFQNMPIEINGLQLATFKTFWDAIEHGAAPFEWKDMTTGATVNFRFVAGQEPQWTNVTPGTTTNLRWYSATLYLEIL